MNYISDALSYYVSVFLSFEDYYKIFYIEEEKERKKDILTSFKRPK